MIKIFTQSRELAQWLVTHHFCVCHSCSLYQNLQRFFLIQLNGLML